MEQIYKNLYYDEEGRCYLFANESDRKYVVDQQSYLLIYILEMLIELKKSNEVYTLNNEMSSKKMRK